MSVCRYVGMQVCMCSTEYAMWCFAIEEDYGKIQDAAFQG